VERTLVERARSGDQEAFAVLATESIGRLYRVAYRILRDPDDARDATQQALLEAWRDLSSLRDPERWEAWTYRLLVRGCGRAARRSRLTEDVAFLPPDQAASDIAASVADRDLLERAFRTLSTDHRAVVVLHDHVGIPLTEVADILGIPAGTARSRHHAALRHLRASIDDQMTVERRPEVHTA
jgi:RNA polymerase sigma-70 factor (ECF subfamily)